MESDNKSHLFDGCDEDSPEQRPPERRHISWQARRLVADYAELAGMSEAERRRYCGGA